MLRSSSVLSRVSSSSVHWRKLIATSIAAGLATLVVGCGGGGSAAVAGPAAPGVVIASTTLSGTVAVGAPMVNAVVTLKDAHGTTVTGSVAADGSYTGLSLDGLTAPYSLQACGLVDGNYACFYSVVAQGGTANVTPLTNATVALALGSDPAGMFAATNAVNPPSAADLTTQIDKLKTALGDTLSAAGVANVDFATSPFSADRTGMDKVLDAVKISTGTDGSSAKTFVQVEGKIGSGNAYLDKDAGSGTLSAGTGLDVDLRGISRIFNDGLSYAVSATDEATCVSRMTNADIFDSAFVLDMGEGVVVDKPHAPAMLCSFIAQQDLLGGVFANPVLKDCDFTTDPANKICVAGFNIVRGENVFEGAELAVVLRTSGSTTAGWKLVGRESPYDIHVGAAVQRSMRVDVPADDSRATPTFTRALQFDITGSDGTNPIAIRKAKVYQHTLDGAGWEPNPMVTLSLSDACIAALRSNETARLTIDIGNNSPCGSSWLALGYESDPNAAAIGDALIDNFYKRGRKVRVDLFTNLGGTGTPVASLVRRVEGVPPKAAALASFPWLQLDSATRAALASFDGTSGTFTASWVANPNVSANDITFCLAGDCQGATEGGKTDVVLGHRSQQITLNHRPANAAAFKEINLYGRDHDQVGVSNNYFSCGGAANCN